MKGKLKISASGTKAEMPPPALAAEAASAPSLTIRVASSSVPSCSFLEDAAEFLEAGLERVPGRPVVGDLEHGDAVAAAAAAEQGECAERECSGATGVTHSRGPRAARG